MTASPLSYGPLISRQLALQQDLKRYYTGKPCKHGHIAPRLTRGRQCIECNKINLKQWIAKDPERERQRVNAQNRKRYARNPKQKQIEHAKRLANDPVFLIRKRLQGRLWSAVKKGYKCASTRALIGISFEQLKEYLELLFQPGMGWSNYGEWHIDHIRPCKTFNLLDAAQQKACFNWRNLQPLDGMQNFSKSDAWTPEMEAEWAQMMRVSGYEGDLFLVFDAA
jgi:hypothetical protein